MPLHRHREDYYYQLVHEHPRRTWVYLAANEGEALQFFQKELGLSLEPCVSPDSYRLEKYGADENGTARRDELLRVTYIKQV